MNPPLPERLRIGPYTWKVVSSKKDWAKQEKDSKIAESDGFTNRITQQIHIRPGLALDYERVVLIHEILHAVRDSAHMTIDLNDAEESFINGTSPLIYATLADNPDLLDYLGLT